jgi:hypothetical protein
MRTSSAHAERVPRLDDRHALGVHRHAELQHRRPVFRIVFDRAGHEQLRTGRAARERLAGVDAIAALDLLGPAGAREPVRSAGGQELDALGGDALEQAGGRRLLMLAAPGRGRRHVGVHRQRQRGRRAMVRQRAQRCRGFGARQPMPAELGGDDQGEKLARAQYLEIGGGELVGLVAAAPLFGELRTDFIEGGAPVERGRCHTTKGQGRHKDAPSLF